jgi:hypothetical protein
MVHPYDTKPGDSLYIKADHTTIEKLTLIDGIAYAKTSRGLLIPLTEIWNTKKRLEV